MKRLEVLLLPLDGMLVHSRSLSRNLLGFPNNLPIPVYTPGGREVLWELSVLPKNTTPCPQPRLEPGPLALESSALTMGPPRLPPYGALLANIKMECQRWPEKPFILERSGTQCVVTVTKRLTCNVEHIKIGWDIFLPHIWLKFGWPYDIITWLICIF